MVNLSILDKEQTIIATLIDCNKQIQSLNESVLNNKSLEKKVNLYHYNFGSVYKQLNESISDQSQDDFVAIKNHRGNYYSYLKNVKNFIEGYEPEIQKSLNESLSIDEKLNPNATQINIFSFKNDLDKILKILEKQNDFDRLDSEIIKIKSFAKQPIMILGFDVCNNLGLKTELYNKFKIQESDLIAICYEKSEHQLFFITSNIIVVYSVKNDLFDLYNIVNKNRQISELTLEPKTYLKVLKEKIEKNTLYELWVNVEKFELKFTDNLYFDNLRNTENKIYQEKKSVIKK